MSTPTKPPAPPSLTNATLVCQPQSKVPQLSAQMDEGIDEMWLMNEAQSRRIVSGMHGREAVRRIRVSRTCQRQVRVCAEQQLSGTSLLADRHQVWRM